MVLSIMTKAVLAATDRQLAVTHNFSSVGFGRPTAMLAKTSRHIEYIFIFRWDLGHNGDAC